MATSTHPTVAAIDNEIKFLNKRLAALEEARELLAPTQSDEATNGGSDDKPTPTKRSSKSTGSKSTSRRQRVVEDDDSSTSSRRSKRLDKRAAERKSSNGKKGESKSDVIRNMLDRGMSPRDIADELDMRPNYVYHVKRQMAEQS